LKLVNELLQYFNKKKGKLSVRNKFWDTSKIAIESLIQFASPKLKSIWELYKELSELSNILKIN